MVAQPPDARPSVNDELHTDRLHTVPLVAAVAEGKSPKCPVDEPAALAGNRCLHELIDFFLAVGLKELPKVILDRGRGYFSELP